MRLLIGYWRVADLMATNDETPSVDIPAGSVNLTTVDTGGCTGNHCHRPRSPRQEGSRNSEGIPYACHRPAGWGCPPYTGTPGYPCKLHGGRTPGALANGQLLKAREAVATYGLPIDVDPLQALLDMVHLAAGHVAWLGTAIANLDADELTWGIAEETVEPDVRSEDGELVTNRVTGKYKAGTHDLVQMYWTERRLLVSASKEAIAAGATQRMVDLYENVYAEIGTQFIDLINRVMERLNLSDDQRGAVPAAVVAELRILSEGA